MTNNKKLYPYFSFPNLFEFGLQTTNMNGVPAFKQFKLIL